MADRTSVGDGARRPALDRPDSAAEELSERMGYRSEILC